MRWSPEALGVTYTPRYVVEQGERSYRRDGNTNESFQVQGTHRLVIDTHARFALSMCEKPQSEKTATREMQKCTIISHEGFPATRTVTTRQVCNCTGTVQGNGYRSAITRARIATKCININAEWWIEPVGKDKENGASLPWLATLVSEVHQYAIGCVSIPANYIILYVRRCHFCVAFSIDLNA